MLLNRTKNSTGGQSIRKVLLQADRDGDAAFIRTELSANRNLTFDVLRVTGVDQVVLCMPDWTPDIALLSLDPRHRAAFELIENYRAILGRIPTIVVAPVADRVCRLLASRAGAEHCIDIHQFGSRRLGRLLKDAIWRLPVPRTSYLTIGEKEASTAAMQAGIAETRY